MDVMDATSDRPRWARRMRDERNVRGWSQAETVEHLRGVHERETGNAGGTSQSLIRQLKGWESGRVRPTYWAPFIAQMFGTVAAEMFPPDTHDAVDLLMVEAAGMDTAELIARLSRSTVSDATVTAVTITVDRLCTDYRLGLPHQLRTEGRAWLTRVEALLRERVTFAQHHQLLSLAGKLALLIGCVEYDLGHKLSAENTRRFAYDLGKEVDDRDVMGWSWEMAAWFALTSGDTHRALAATRTGLDIAGRRGVAVQLAAQAAKASARLGDAEQVTASLDTGRTILADLPLSENPDNHFEVDPAKWLFYEMDVRRAIGDNKRARLYADEVLRLHVGPEGADRAPMRTAEARITHAVLAARDGAVTDAVDMGIRALSGPRMSVPSLSMIARELSTELATAGLSNDPRTRDYHDALTHLTESAQDS